MKIDDVDFQYIQDMEGFSPVAYYCSANKRTIGYGHVILDDEDLPSHITKDEALDILKKDLSKFEDAVNKYIKVPLNQNQFTALVFFCFNVGINAFKDSTLVKELNRGHYDRVPDQMRRWKFVNGKINKGLINRREKEILIWEE